MPGYLKKRLGAVKSAMQNRLKEILPGIQLEHCLHDSQKSFSYLIKSQRFALDTECQNIYVL